MEGTETRNCLYNNQNEDNISASIMIIPYPDKKKIQETVKIKISSMEFITKRMNFS